MLCFDVSTSSEKCQQLHSFFSRSLWNEKNCSRSCKKLTKSQNSAKRGFERLHDANNLFDHRSSFWAQKNLENSKWIFWNILPRGRRRMWDPPRKKSWAIFRGQKRAKIFIQTKSPFLIHCSSFFVTGCWIFDEMLRRIMEKWSKIMSDFHNVHIHGKYSIYVSGPGGIVSDSCSWSWQASPPYESEAWDAPQQCRV